MQLLFRLSFFFSIVVILVRRENLMTLVLFPTEKTYLHRDLLCLLFLHTCDLFPHGCEVAFLTAQKYNQTFETWGLLSVQRWSSLWDDFSKLSKVQLSLAAVFCVPSCHLNVTETVCVQRLSFLYTLGNLFCPLQWGLLHVNVWWKHLSLSVNPVLCRGNWRNCEFAGIFAEMNMA